MSRIKMKGNIYIYEIGKKTKPTNIFIYVCC